MLFELGDINNYFAFNKDYSFHNLQIMSLIKIKKNIYDTLIENLNNKNLKGSVASDLVGAKLIDNNITYIDINTLKTTKPHYFSNLTEIYKSLFLPSHNISFGKCDVTYENGTFFVSIDDKIMFEKQRNIVYNLLCASIIIDYKGKK